MDDYSYTLGPPSDVLDHVRLIDRGGFGEVHELTIRPAPSFRPKSYHQYPVQFARKLLRPFGSVTKDDIENEVKAIINICASGGHEYIIKILGHGPLRASDYYYIDMELCDFDLENYLRNPDRASLLSSSLDAQDLLQLSPYFSPKWSSVREKRENVWGIMDDISTGLEFLHKQGYAHRDLKPRNVLYQLLENKWVITDFGITCQATTDLAMPTLNSRGTGGYRAPELLTTPPAFTKKVDIWALGCILYELLMAKKAFTDDWTVRDYSTSNSESPEVTELDLPGGLNELPEHETQLLSRLFARDPLQRPRISELQPIFQSYATLSSDSVWGIISAAKVFPPFSLWIAIADKSTSTSDLIRSLSAWYHRPPHTRTAASLTYLLVSEAPDDDLIRVLQRQYETLWSLDTTISGWRSLVLQYPYKTNIRNALTKACVTMGGYSHAAAIWETIVERDPTNLRFMLEYAEATAQAQVEGKAEVRAAEILLPLVEKYPRVTRHRDQLKMVLKRIGLRGREVQTWKDLVRKHPQERELVAELKRACEEMGELEKVVSLWKDLVDEHPEVPELREELRHALRWNGDCTQAIDVWDALKQKYPENKGIEREWLEACREKDESVDELKRWRSLMSLKDLNGDSVPEAKADG